MEDGVPLSRGLFMSSRVRGFFLLFDVAVR